MIGALRVKTIFQNGVDLDQLASFIWFCPAKFRVCMSDSYFLTHYLCMILSEMEMKDSLLQLTRSPCS